MGTLPVFVENNKEFSTKHWKLREHAKFLLIVESPLESQVNDAYNVLTSLSRMLGDICKDVNDIYSSFSRSLVDNFKGTLAF